MLIADYRACRHDDQVQIFASSCLLDVTFSPTVELFQMHSGPALVLGYEFDGWIEEIVFTRLAASTATMIAKSRRVIIHDDQSGVRIEADAVTIVYPTAMEKLL